ncbi:MAG: AMP-binding protein [Spirochaetes bacterium]|nr:AMP-binding protein [Spirochaetota bacterium]
MKTLLQKSDSTAVVYNDVKFSYNDLLENIDTYYNLIAEIKVQKIVIYSENRPEYIFAFYAGLRKGTIVVPVDYMSTSDEIKYIIQDCKPEVIFTSESGKKNISEALKGIRRKTEIFVFDKIRKKSSKNAENIIANDLNKTALLIYTSGTTGSPKGVMLSFENLFVNIDAVVDVGIYNKNECFLMLLPVHHIFPLLGTLIAPLCVQAKIAMSPSMATDDILKTLSENKVTIIIGVPRFYELIRKGIMDKINAGAVTKFVFKLAGVINSKALSVKLFAKVHERFGGSIKYLISGGAALDTAVSKDFVTLGFDVLEGYGMTESAPMITFPRPDNVKLGSTGQPLPGVDVKIIKGEICARGKNIMQGYYNRPEETADVLKNGWLHTGDLGELDEDNFLRITGRKKDIIILPNGKNINPSEIEEKLLSISDVVQESAVFFKDNKLQAVLHINNSAKKESPDSEQKLAYDIISKYNNSVSPYKRLMRYTITDTELPKTRLGKIKRFELASIQTSEKKKTANAPVYREYTIIKDYLESETGNTISPDDHFEFDLGLDSLSKVGLTVFLEKTFGINIKDEHLMHYPNLLKLSEYVKEKKVKIHKSIVNWADILKEKVHVKLPRSWYTTELFKYASKGIFKIWFKAAGRGIKNIPNSPFILAPNHQSFFDGMFVAIFLKRRLLKNTYFYAKSKHVNNSLVKFIARKNNVIVVDITNDLKGSIQKLAEVLRKGKNIIIFPEGTRTRDGKLGVFKQTFAILSRELNIPVVPVAINGAYDALPSGSKFPKFFKKVTVDFLKPVYPEKKSYKMIINSVEKAIAQKLEAK